ncbi:MAG: hypothetical protein H7296_09725 [Bacteroidia bacterium]|nr:hypothetical protein [Bacteroidia bacterium]
MFTWVFINETLQVLQLKNGEQVPQPSSSPLSWLSLSDCELTDWSSGQLSNIQQGIAASSVMYIEKMIANVFIGGKDIKT